MNIDFHCHILPRIDDGAEDIDTSLKMLKAEESDGVDTVVLTPHFYLHKTTVAQFIEKRAISFDKIRENDEFNGRLLLGAEVYFSPKLFETDISSLCIENTDFMLLELPYEKLTNSITDTVGRFITSCGKKIIIAHIERYLSYTDIESLESILSYGAISQMNCEGFCSFSQRKKSIELLENGFAQAIGTDAHDLKSRSPNFGKAEKIIRKKCGGFERVMETSQMILENRKISEIMNV